MQAKDENRITGRAFFLGALFSAVFAWLTVFFSNRHDLQVTATQIPVLPYALLLVTVLLINPLCRLLRRVRFFTPAEIMTVFMMGLVSSGLSSYGLAAQLAPVVGSLFNRSWYTQQSQWDRHIAPFVNDAYFLAEDGISDAARAYLGHVGEREALLALRNAAARDVAAEAALAEAERRLASVRGEEDGVALRHRDGAAAAAVQARSAWSAAWLAARGNRPELAEEAGAALPLLEAGLETATGDAAASLNELREREDNAFARVEMFRRGLPRGLRAYPGVVRLAGDTRAGYLARFQRTVEGRRVAADLHRVEAMLRADGGDRSAMAERMQAVADRIARMSETSALEAEIESGLEDGRGKADRLAERESALREMRSRRREAEREEMRRLDRDIQREHRVVGGMRRRLAADVRARQYQQQQVESLARGRGLVDVAVRMQESFSAGRTPDDAGESIGLLREGLSSLDGTLRRYLVGDVPWRDWARPLLRWGLLVGLTYLVLMAFNVLIFRQWAHHEKLIYPLADLSMTLAGVGDAPGHLPAVFRSGLFWVGLGVSGIILGYNVLVETRLVPGLVALDLRNVWVEYIRNTSLQGLLGASYARSNIFFTVIGLSFLVPRKVSFSLWFFVVLSMLQVLILVWSGYGQNEASFPTEWWYTLNFRTGQGGGALMVFASVVLYKCRHYLFCALRPASVRNLERDEQIELRVASFCFLLGSIGIVLMLWIGMGAHPVYTVAVCLSILVITIGLIRAVAEGGILAFQAWAGPFHFIRSFFGMNRTWTAPALFAPLMVYYSILFFDIKTFIAPAMANSLKIRDTLRMRRGQFHASVFTAIAIAAVVSVVMSIMMAYADGADLMQRWFFTNFPRGLFSHMGDMARNPPVAARPETLWVLTGAGAMALLLFFRRSAFWLPHPIGMIMLVNPIMAHYWFSILLGWIFKSLVTKYGNKETYGKARTLFIGLIAGELIVVVIGMTVAYTMEIPVSVGLNR